MELETERFEDGIMIKEGFKAAKKPYVVTENNSWEKSQFEVIPTEEGLPIPVEYGSKLYELAKYKSKSEPLCGTVFAEPIPYNDLMNHYWLDDIEIIDGVA